MNKLEGGGRDNSRIGKGEEDVTKRTSKTPAICPVPVWAGSAWQTESTFHQLSPYIGKTKSSMAASLIAQYTRKSDIVYDPFSGCGTIALEAWLAGRHVVANDLSPYANLLTRAKLFPYESIEQALHDLEVIAQRPALRFSRPDLRSTPKWVRNFFHPETLREILIWTQTLKNQGRWFLLACLMGILHHQRPGFLSFPSSHTVPYLRVKKFPKRRYPKLYEYRSLRDRLEAKVRRAFRRVPDLDFDLIRLCHSESADKLVPDRRVDAIVTSPPYMRQLDYGRDNRLRLWFLGCQDWHSLDSSISPREREFLTLMAKCFEQWRNIIKPNGNCVLVIGDACTRANYSDLPEEVIRLAAEAGGFSLVSEHTDLIPNERRVRRGIIGSTSETVLVLRNAPTCRTHVNVSRTDHAAAVQY